MEVGLIPGALALDPEAFRRLAEHPAGWRLALWVVFLAGLSSGVGQSLVLFANRVRPHRFVVSLVVSAGLYLFGFVAWALSVWLAADLIFGREASVYAVSRAIGLGYSPYLFGFFVLTPYLGSFIAVALSIWSLLAILVAVQTTLQMTLPQALVSSAAGWLLLQVSQRTIGRPLTWAAGRLRSAVAGTRLERDLDVLFRGPGRRSREDA